MCLAMEESNPGSRYSVSTQNVSRSEIRLILEARCNARFSSKQTPFWISAVRVFSHTNREQGVRARNEGEKRGEGVGSRR